MDLAIARNFPIGGSRQAQFRVDAFNVFNATVFSARSSTVQFVSPTDQTVRNPQFNADGSIATSGSVLRVKPQDAGFGAATAAQAMRTVQIQLRFQF